MQALFLCYHSVASCTCKDDFSASSICHLQMFIFSWLEKGRPKQVSSCCFGGLFYNSYSNHNNKYRLLKFITYRRFSSLRVLQLFVCTWFTIFSEYTAELNSLHTTASPLLGLGTFTSKEAKEYFSDMLRHRIKFHYNGAQDDHSINMVSDEAAFFVMS